MELRGLTLQNWQIDLKFTSLQNQLSSNGCENTNLLPDNEPFTAAGPQEIFKKFIRTFIHLLTQAIYSLRQEKP